MLLRLLLVFLALGYTCVFAQSGYEQCVFCVPKPNLDCIGRIELYHDTEENFYK